MKKILLLLGVSLAVLVSGNALAYNKYVTDVNNSCDDGSGNITIYDCTDCHTSNYKDPTDQKDLFLSGGACAFCDWNSACVSGPPTIADLYDEARNTITLGYFEDIFGQFISHLSDSMGQPDPFADVFPDCPELAATIASDHSREHGALVRRVTTKTRNQRNIPDEWELEQLLKFEQMAANGEQRDLMKVTDPRPTSPFADGMLPSAEFEAYEVVSEEIGKGKNKVTKHYFRYMRSLTIPPLPYVAKYWDDEDTRDPDKSGPPQLPSPIEEGKMVPNPQLPCMKCHGTGGQVSEATRAAIQTFYPYDTAMGYSGGQIRGAWSVKIPLDEVPQ